MYISTFEKKLNKDVFFYKFITHITYQYVIHAYFINNIIPCSLINTKFTTYLIFFGTAKTDNV